MQATRVEPEGKELVITRTFDAPRELVFKACTDAKYLAQWWGPHGFTAPVCRVDLRPGGEYYVVMRAPDGNEFPTKGVYREVVPPERLVMTNNFEDHPDEWQEELANNRIDGRRDFMKEVLLTMTFEDLSGGRTKLEIRYHFESEADREALLKMGMSEGWKETLERLEALLAEM